MKTRTILTVACGALCGCGPMMDETRTVLIVLPSIVAALVAFYLVYSTRLAILRTAAAAERMEKTLARMDERAAKAGGEGPPCAGCGKALTPGASRCEDCQRSVA